MQIEGAKDRLQALSEGVERAWGMTFEEYANLCVDDPAAAERVAEEAVKRLTAGINPASVSLNTKGETPLGEREQ